MVHDAIRCREDERSELTSWQDSRCERLEVIDGDVETWADDAALVQATHQVDDDLAATMVVDNFELTNVSFRERLRRRVNK
jgi:hypothetical protein